MEITYTHCLLAALGQKILSFPSLKERYRSVLYVAEGQDLQVCSSSSDKFVLSQTLSSAHTWLFLFALVGLLSFESQSFLSHVSLDYLHWKVFSRFQNSSLGPEKWRKTHKCHEGDELLRKFQIDVIKSSPDGFHWLDDVTIDVKRSFF